MIFPADRPLHKPEDGVALPGGRVLVSDAVSGLRLIEADGTSRPFGDMVAAGYVHNPPAREGGANGVSLEPGGSHVLVTDMEGCSIYRVDVATGAAQKIYQHRYGINAAVRDSRGTIWFTQSAHNTPETGIGAMWAAVDAGRAEGALLRLPMTGDSAAGEAEILLDSLVFANGITIDERNGLLYLSEMMANRVLRYRVDLVSGALSDRTVVLEGHAVDNVELDDEGMVWLVAPLSNTVIVLDPATDSAHTVFRLHTPAQDERIAEFNRRGERGAPRLELLGPDTWGELPGFITGLILTPGGGPVYLTGLGDALVRLPR
jgi:sugar lactone lactonase YvrE